MQIILFCFTFILILLTSGCATKPPAVHYYVLSQTQQITDIQQNEYDRVIGISRLSMATHLSKLGIVMVQSEREIHTAHYHRWAEDPELGIARTLQSDLSQTNPHIRFDNSYSAILPDWQYRIHIQVDQFNGSKDSDAIFAGYWRIEDIHSNQIIAAKQFFFQQPMAGQGYAKLVAALRQCVSLLAQELDQQIHTAINHK